MTPIAHDDETDWHDVASIAASRFLATRAAIERRVTGVLVPFSRGADDVARRTLQPSGKPNTDEFARSRRVDARPCLRGNGRQTKTIDVELLLQARLENRLRIPYSRRGRLLVPFLQAPSYNRNRGAAKATCAKVDYGPGAMRRNHLAPSNISKLNRHRHLLPLAARTAE